MGTSIRKFMVAVDKTKQVDKTSKDEDGETVHTTETVHYTDMEERTEVVRDPRPSNDALTTEDDLYDDRGITAPVEGFSKNTDGTWRFNGTQGDDDYTVAQNTAGDLLVTNNTTHQVFTLPAADAASGVEVRAWMGDDQVRIDKSVTMDVHAQGGFGDDRIDASGNTARQTIAGGLGDDRLIGGLGADAIDGGYGDDWLAGGAGNDQLIGGGDDDYVSGGDGDDLVMGGDGADSVNGGDGGDAIYADSKDRVDAGGTFDLSTYSVRPDDDLDLIVSDGATVVNAGTDDVHATYDPKEVDAYLRAHPELVIDGSPTFVQRTRMDIGAMLATEQGQGLLDELTAELVDRGETLTIVERQGAAGGGYSPGANEVEVGQWAEKYPDGTNRMPLPALFHELTHAYQDLISGFPEGNTSFPGGTTARNVERQATGLSWIDDAGTLHPANELPYSDNLFRTELGLPSRLMYTAEGVGAPVAYVP
jgi:Ca2+-binding RTX toxin-like protein